MEWTPESLYIHFDALYRNMQLQIDGRFKGISERIMQINEARIREIDLRFKSAQEAVDKAETAASKLAETHNDLIRKGERDAAKYVTRTEHELVLTMLARLQGFQAKLVGALALVTFLLPSITAGAVYLFLH